ncbi:2-oxoglutarate-Fe(II) type oxidoreductase hxnY isoform X2 [Cryptomeria japonica]|uniref:2-oxoglutarate-Fe(II) type oxidoreductase hxnY isoform X2 n=1 Tax=Cryptomeria japonica TaxID=3369 RepID=UPI0027DA3E22|nr:2-oxoglutarate-Fe(II) type oxidoreductase hxnY isoform X2 [Cryptomeria japonica]
MSSVDCPLACIDLSNPDRQAIAVQIRKACIDCGFFYVINHGVEQKLFDQVFEQSRHFFALPQEEKIKLVLNESHRGYTPYQAEALNPSVQSQGDWKESFYIGPQFSETSGDQKNRFYGPNQWPSNELLPQWREIMLDYYENVLNVGRRLVSLIAVALNLEETFFNKPGMMDEPLAFARLLHYPSKQPNLDHEMIGAAAHSDYGMLTLLSTNGMAGLQICRNKDVKPQNWEDIPPLKGAFVINIGDMLERWSNCLFRFSPICSGDYLQERIKMTYSITS